MKFGSQVIPEALFSLARGKMLAEASFTPESIRRHLVTGGREEMLKVNAIERNHTIIANRVMRVVLKELVDQGKVKPLKRGLWVKASVMDA